MQIAILGWGSQGQSAYEYWNTPDNQITVCDKDETLSLPDNIEAQLGADYLDKLDRFELLIRTPALHPRDIVAANPDTPNILDKVWSNTNEFFKACPSKNIIGITGTKGKGTTSTLIAKMLEAAGKRVHLGGNIGIPPLELLKDNIQPDDWIVLELANFQLIDLKYSPHIAACVMVSPEHLDWHEDFDEYIDTKQQLFINQSADDIAIYYAKNKYSESIASASDGQLIPYFKKPGAEVINKEVRIDDKKICNVDELKLLGQHNWQNACAALTVVWQITQDMEAIRPAITNFSGLPYRIEFRREINDVRYYNDSFASGQGATIAAMDAIPGMKVMIIGGYDRMLDLTELSQALIDRQNQLRKVVLIGASAQRTADALKSSGFTNFMHCTAKDMPSIVSVAQAESQPGDAVVLSPAFASFDMFKNFEDRGNKFNEAVESL